MKQYNVIILHDFTRILIQNVQQRNFFDLYKNNALVQHCSTNQLNSKAFS